jgi:hypothetical protein
MHFLTEATIASSQPSKFLLEPPTCGKPQRDFEQRIIPVAS